LREKGKEGQKERQKGGTKQMAKHHKPFYRIASEADTCKRKKKTVMGASSCRTIGSKQT